MDRTAAAGPRNLAIPDAASTRRQYAVLAKILAIIKPGNEQVLAQRLLQEFGSVDRILAQSPEALDRIGSDGAAVSSLLLGARDLMVEALRSDLAMRLIDPTDTALQRYLILSMGSLPDETLRILFLDGGHRLLADEQLQRGSIAALSFYPRTLFRRALEHNAAAILLVHNHPSGDARPSREDIEATRQIGRIGRALDVDLLDHIIVTRTEAHPIGRLDEKETLAAANSASTLRSGEDELNDERALDNALRTMRRRLLRRQLIGAEELFGEPAWDLLIDLFIEECRGRHMPISSLSVATDASMSSAVRLVRRLCEAGLIVRVPDPEDGRRTFIRLMPETLHRMRVYFGSAKA